MREREVGVARLLEDEVVRGEGEVAHRKRVPHVQQHERHRLNPISNLKQQGIKIESKLKYLFEVFLFLYAIFETGAMV